jgi:hypothetical protein
VFSGVLILIGLAGLPDDIRTWTGWLGWVGHLDAEAWRLLLLGVGIVLFLVLQDEVFGQGLVADQQVREPDALGRVPDLQLAEGGAPVYLLTILHPRDHGPFRLLQ